MSHIFRIISGDADDSSDLMAVELDFEHHAFLREMDSPTGSFRTPSPRRPLQNNGSTRYAFILYSNKTFPKLFVTNSTAYCMLEIFQIILL